ncbi:chaperonin 10-like protein [Schizothecium vesticola]|uniref:Chaperonin 10-like protein n=1 Tax=Schizothecium vesticola TaxID=314040 RepID=A0AA40BR28_9PEZI|nr:chaperonin 10-like protein [Schizothecium vesticola]
MRSYSQLTTGPPSPATLALTTVPAPSPSPTGTSLLLRITHAALNPIDLHLLLNLPAWLPFRRRPTPGFDFSGVVLALGPAVPASSGIKVGDRVAGSLGARQVALGVGSLAEYISVPVGLVAKVPDGWDGGQAAGGMGVAGQTAVLFARTIGEERVKGARVLVNGASGGVGVLLVQVLKGLGAGWVVGVCGGGNEGMVRGLGADEVVDYGGEEARGEGGLEGVLEGKFGGEGRFDFVLDCAGGQRLFERSVGFLKEGGRFVSIVGGRSQGVVPFVRNKLRPVMLGGTPRRYDLLAMMPSGEQAEVMKGWMEKGVVKEVPVDSEWVMEDVIKAYEKLETKHAKGKIIVKVAA